MDPVHEPVRVWWAPWRRRCSCGARRWPCPDTTHGKSPPPAYWLSLRNTKAHWIDEMPEESPDGEEPDETDDRLRRSRSRQRRRWPW
jgi:hypothetical protein